MMGAVAQSLEDCFYNYILAIFRRQPKERGLLWKNKKSMFRWNFMKSGRKNLKTEKSTKIRKRHLNRFLTGKKNMKYSLIVASRSMRNEV